MSASWSTVAIQPAIAVGEREKRTREIEEMRERRGEAETKIGSVGEREMRKRSGGKERKRVD